jgi:hypothetical protein
VELDCVVEVLLDHSSEGFKSYFFDVSVHVV